MEKQRLLVWMPKLYVMGMVLALVFVIPTVWFPIQVGKMVFVALASLGAVVALWWSGEIGALLTKKSRWAFLVFLLPAVYALSWLFSMDRAVGISGSGIEVDTLIFVLLGALVFVVASGVFRSTPSGRMLLAWLGAASVFAMLFQVILLAFGTTVMPLAVFANHATNLVGKWNDLGVLAGLVLVLHIGWLEFSGERRRSHVVYAAVASILSVLILAVVNFALVWSLVLVFSVAFIGWRFFSTRSVAWYAVACAVIALNLLVWGAPANQWLTANPNAPFPVTSLEVRPSPSSTLFVDTAAHASSPAGRFLVGSGPQTFGLVWLAAKPTSVNQSTFWNLDFMVGYSTLLTAFGSVGLLGVLAWLIPIGLVIWCVVRAVRSRLLAQEEAAVLLGIGGAALYLWLCLALYVPSANVVLVAFVLAGAAFGLSVKGEKAPAPARAEPAAKGTKASIVKRALAYVQALGRVGIAPVVAGVLVVLLVGASFVVMRRALATSYANQAVTALGAGDVDGALSSWGRAYGIESTPDTMRLGVDINAVKISQLVSSSTLGAAEQKLLNARVLQVIALGNQLVAADPQDYKSYLSLGKFYAMLASYGVPDAYGRARETLSSAIQHNPQNPQLWLNMAQIDARHGDDKASIADISEALRRKSDYTDAIMFVVQFYIAKKDLPNAINAARAAVQSNPNLPTALFELGLLYYSNNDTADAIPPLERAVAVQPDYANAQYFLGLSYAAQGRNKDALAQFDNLVKTNPDNDAVITIRARLQQGKPPFASAGKPASALPSKSTTNP